MVRRARREDDATRDDATNDDVTRDDATPDDLTGEDATRDAQTLFSPGSPTESFLRYLDEQIAMLQRSGAGGPDTETGTGTENDGDCSAEIALVVDAADEAIRGGVAIDRQALVDHFPQYSPRLGKVLQTLRWVRKTAFVPDEKRRDECETPLPEIPDYKVSRRLGAGGMGVVYKARQLSLQRDVALKIIPQTLLSNELAIRRFELEARAAASLDHPHIVQVFDTGSSGGQHYFTMQLVRGSGLDQVVKRLHQSRMEARSNRIRWDLSKQQLGGALPAPASSSMDYERNHHREDSATLRAGLTFYQQVAAIGRDVAGALEHAHQNDVLHRDIKPSNLMLDRDGKVWVTDFGLAKTGDSELTGTGDIVGTIQFIAPERFSGFCDRRSDLYSLGMTLYELVSLQPAFARGDPLSLIARIRDTDPIPLSQIDRKLPRDLQTIIETSIQKDPARRYQSAGAMMADLQRFLRDEPIQARPAGRSYKAYRWLRRNRLAGSAIIASAVAILLLTVGSAYAAVRFAGDARAQLKLTLQADAAKRNAETLSEQNRRNLYAAEMRLAVDAAREPSGGPTVRSWLQRWDQPADRDRHGFEWHWLSGVVNPPATPLRFAAPDTLPAASPRNLAYAIDGQTAFLANRGLQYRNVSPLFDDTPTETHQQADAIATHRSTRRVACMIDGRCVWTHDPDRRSGGWSHDLPGVSAIAFIGPQWIAAIRQNPSKQNAYELFLLSVADGSVAAVLDCPQLDSTHLLPKYLRADVDDRWLALATHVAGEVHVHFFRVRNALPIDDDPTDTTPQVEHAGKVTWLGQAVSTMNWNHDTGALMVAEDNGMLTRVTLDRDAREIREGVSATKSERSFDSTIRSMEYLGRNQFLLGHESGAVRYIDASTLVDLGHDFVHEASVVFCGVTGDRVHTASEREGWWVRSREHLPTAKLIGPKTAGPETRVRTQWSIDGQSLAISKDTPLRFWDLDRHLDWRAGEKDRTAALPSESSPGTLVGEPCGDDPKFGLVHYFDRWVTTFDPGSRRLAWLAPHRLIDAPEGVYRCIEYWDATHGRALFVLNERYQKCGLAWAKPVDRDPGSDPSDRPPPGLPADTQPQYAGFATCETALEMRRGEMMLPLRLSHGGKWVCAFGSASAQTGWLELLDISTTQTRRIASLDLDFCPLDAAVSPDQKRVAICDQSANIQIFSLPDGEWMRAVTGHMAQVRSLDWSPDGKRLASGAADRTMRLWETEHFTNVMVWEVDAPVEHVRFSTDGKRFLGVDHHGDSILLSALGSSDSGTF